MEKYLEILGYEVRDRVSGFVGVADSVCFDLYGCVQVAVCPKYDEKDKERKHSSWFDFKRLEKTGAHAAMAMPKFVTPGDENGPAFKAPR